MLAVRYEEGENPASMWISGIVVCVTRGDLVV